MTSFIHRLRGDARYATKETNAGVRVVAGFLDFWQPSTLLVEAGVSAPAQGRFAAVVASTWSGIPGDATDGRILNTDVVVTMDASLGGFNALDNWRNNISGAGMLALGGSNSYSGGTQLVGGTLQADSATAFGQGNVYVGGGVLVCNAPSTAMMAAAYTQLPGTTLQLNLGGNGAGRLNVAGVAALDGTLNLSFKPGFVPSAGDTLTVISGGTLTGRFSAINAPGFKVTPTYTGTQLIVRFDA